MVHLALCSIVCLSGLDGFMGGNMASLQCVVLSYMYANDVFCIRIVFMSVPTVRSASPQAAPTPTPLRIIPSPSVYCLKSHRANWDRAASGAEETWSHRSGNWTLLRLSALPLSLASPQPPPLSAPHLSDPPQLSSVPFTHGESVYSTTQRERARQREGMIER